MRFTVFISFVIFVVTSYAQSSIDDFGIADNQSFEAIVLQHASNQSILIAFSNYGYRLFACNMVLTLQMANVSNYLVVALDSQSHNFFLRHKIPTYFDPNIVHIDTAAQHHQSATFKSIMELRLHFIIRALKLGISVLFTDVDAVFNANPFTEFDSGKQVEFAYDTPFLPSPGVKSSPLMVMAGFFYMKDCTNYPSNCELLQQTLEYQSLHPDKHDQFCLNQVLYDRKDIDYNIMDPLLFTNGALYFADRSSQMLGIKPIVIQNNWITGSINKVHRFREHLLWHLDPPKYYNPNTKFLVYSNIQSASLGVIAEFQSLVNGLALASLLNRTLVLPLFCVYRSEMGLYDSTADWCTVDEYFQLDPAVFDFREHSFFLNPKVPQEIRDAESNAIKIQILLPKDDLLQLDLSGRDVYQANDPNGASEEEILTWLSAYQSTVLDVGDVHKHFKGFSSQVFRSEFSHLIHKGLTLREEIDRHAKTLRASFPSDSNYSCIYTWGSSKYSSFWQKDDAIIEKSQLLIPSDNQVFVSTDGLTADTLDNYRPLWKDVMGFQLYPWIRQGFRKHQHTLLINNLMCRNAELFVGNSDSLPSTLMCSRRIDNNQHCAEIALRTSWPPLPQQQTMFWLEHAQF